ncbi:acyl-CoA dehydrogenase family protein [Bordetella muralis]|uniref:acyl-CoA dehydrogenase family protein n=1 Tax=Bordetella muralis TaxID=1649130 RepID=UPI0039F135E0
MHLEINSALAELRPALRKFVTERLDPIAARIDSTGEVPSGTRELIAAQGYLGMRLPAEYGGAETDLSTYCLAIEEMGRSHRVFTLMLDASSGLTPIALVRHGTSAQKLTYLPKLANGEWTASFALTEPDAGSDAAALRTRAQRCEGGWRITGTKQYISGAHYARVIMVIAVTDAAKRAGERMTAFLVDKDTPGMTISRIDKTIGSDPMQLAELHFDDCFVPDTAVLGQVGQGFPIAMGSLTSGRMGVACSCLGTADKLLELSIGYAKNRSTFGKPLSERQAIQWMLADSATELAAARALAYDTLRRIDAGEDVGTAPSVVKLYCSEMVGRVADRAIQIHGGAGLIRNEPVERFYRDVRHYRIGEGSSEIQRMLIARDLCR